MAIERENCDEADDDFFDALADVETAAQMRDTRARDESIKTALDSILDALARGGGFHDLLDHWHVERRA